MLSHAEERWIRGLARRRERERQGLFVAEGVRVVEELIAGTVVPRLAVISSSLEDTERGRALKTALEAAVEVRSVGAGVLNGLSDTGTSQGVLVVAETPVVGLAGLRIEGAGTVLVLDGVQDPGNLGTLVRSAVAFGVDVVACLPGTVDPWNGKSVRASAGALFRAPVVQTPEAELMEWLDAGGVALLGADAAGRPVADVALPQRAALAVGNEGAGLSAAVRDRCSELVSVPMRGGAESLNVAVAAGILLYLITGERG